MVAETKRQCKDNEENVLSPPIEVYLPIGWVSHMEKEVKKIKKEKVERFICRP